jgi:hypothetical protein
VTLRQAEDPTFLERLRSAFRSVFRRRRAWGHRAWAIPGGHIPLESEGEEPRLTSRDEACILNATARDAKIEVTVYYSNRGPVGPYRFTVGGERTRHIRFNDLIDPEAIPLDTAFAALVESNVPVIVQFFRLTTERGRPAMMGTMAHPVS